MFLYINHSLKIRYANCGLIPLASMEFSTECRSMEHGELDSPKHVERFVVSFLRCSHGKPMNTSQWPAHREISSHVWIPRGSQEVSRAEPPDHVFPSGLTRVAEALAPGAGASWQGFDQATGDVKNARRCLAVVKACKEGIFVYCYENKKKWISNRF